MASTITNLITTISIDYPVAGQDNDSQGFRDNFNRIRQSLLNIQGEVEGIQSTISELGGSVYVTATYVTAVKSLTIGPDTITVDTSTNQLVVTTEGKSGTVVLRPNTVQAVIAEALTDSVTTITTGTFAVDDVRNIQVGASVTLKNALRTVTNVNAGNNWLTVTPEFTEPLTLGEILTFTNPFFSTSENVGDLIVQGNIYATGNITAFYATPSDARLKENVRIIDNALDKVKQISGVFYDWNQDYTSKLPSTEGFVKADLGVIAQNVESVIPVAVTTDKDGYLGVKYEKLTGLLIEAIKELSNEVDNLKSKLHNV